MSPVADAIREVTAAMQKAIASGERSAAIDAEDLIDILLAAMGQGWSDREAAIVAAARHLGFRRTGTNLRAAFKSAINAAIRRDLIETNGPQQIRKMRNKG